MPGCGYLGAGIVDECNLKCPFPQPIVWPRSSDSTLGMISPVPFALLRRSAGTVSRNGAFTRRVSCTPISPGSLLLSGRGGSSPRAELLHQVDTESPAQVFIERQHWHMGSPGGKGPETGRALTFSGQDHPRLPSGYPSGNWKSVSGTMRVMRMMATSGPSRPALRPST